MAKLHIWQGDVDIECPSELYGITHGSCTIQEVLNGKRHVNLGDGAYYQFTDADVKWITEHQSDEDVTMKTFDDPVLQNISLMTPDGKRLLLPQDIVFDNYNDVKKKLTQCLGKYKNNAFEFPIDAEIMQRKILDGTINNLKKELQFFGTPDDVCDLLICQIIGMLGPGYRALEPSAGQGAIISHLQKFRPEMEITAIEYSEVNYAVLKDKVQNVNCIHGDFLTMEPEDVGGRFDLIIANPPFSKGQDVQHIMHMWKFLKPGGQLIAMSSAAVKTNTQKKYEEFRNFVDFHCGYMMPVERGAFRSSGTDVETYINVLHKPWYQDEVESKVVEKIPERKEEEKKPEGGGQMSLF